MFCERWLKSLRLRAEGSGVPPVRKVEAVQEDSEEDVVNALVGLGRSLENS